MFQLTKMRLQGFNKVKDQGGGFEAWVKNGFPVTKPKA